MKLLCFSDLHVGEKNWRGQTVDNVGRLRSACQTIADRYDPDEWSVLVPGDLVEHGAADEFRRLEHAMAPLIAAGFVVIAPPGNHDHGLHGLFHSEQSEAMARGTAVRLSQGLVAGWPARLELDTFDLLLLDSTAKGGSSRAFARGRVGQQQIAWLAPRVVASRPIVVGLHHCVKTRNPTLDLEDSDDLLAVTNRDNVTIVHGHLHDRQVYRPTPDRPLTLRLGKFVDGPRAELLELDPEAGTFEFVSFPW